MQTADFRNLSVRGLWIYLFHRPPLNGNQIGLYFHDCYICLTSAHTCSSVWSPWSWHLRVNNFYDSVLYKSTYTTSMIRSLIKLNLFSPPASAASSGWASGTLKAFSLSKRARLESLSLLFHIWSLILERSRLIKRSLLILTLKSWVQPSHVQSPSCHVLRICQSWRSCYIRHNNTTNNYYY